MCLLQWHHNERCGVSNHRRIKSLLNLCSDAHQRKQQSSPSRFPSLRANNAEYVSIWWRHHDIPDFTCLERTAITITNSRKLLLHMLYYMNWLTYDFWTRTGAWEFDRSHGTVTSSPSHWQQVEEKAPRLVGWVMCFLLMTFVPVQKLYVNKYIYIYALL